MITKSEEKQINMIQPYVDDIQTYVNANICNGRAMTAANICEGFKKEHECELSDINFITAFRTAVRYDKITGIVGTKRLGYREIGNTEINRVSANTVDVLEPYYQNIQFLVDRYIQGDVRMTAAVIYKKFKKEYDCELLEDEFVKNFRFAIRDKKITGLESAYKFGYKRKGFSSMPETSEEVSIPVENINFEILIDERRRLVVVDRLNWGFQIRKDSGNWFTESYFGNAFSALKGVARKILDDEFKNSDNIKFEDFPQLLEKAENRIAFLLEKVINQ